MKRVLACVDGSPSSLAVQRTARRVADLLGAEMEVIHVLVESEQRVIVDLTGKRVMTGDPARVLVDESRQPDVIAIVLGARSMPGKPIGRLTRRLLAASPVPLVVIPVDSPGLDESSRRLLVPLDGDPETTAALRPLATALHHVGVDVHVVHFLDSRSVPPFIGIGQDVEILAEEFRVLHLPECCDRCELRLGHPGQHLIEMIRQSDDDEGIDAVLLAWHRNLEPGRAETLQRLLREGSVPMIVVPIAEHHRSD